MRELASRTVRPNYPIGSLAEKVGGVAVAELGSGRGGGAVLVDILEAPDPAIGEAVQDALMQWKFSMLEKEGHPPAWPRAKMIFYFVPVEEGYVFYPDEMAAWQRKTTEPTAEDVGRALEVSEEDLLRMESDGDVSVVDIQPRGTYGQGHREGSINIPFGELRVRARVELVDTVPVVLDCSFSSELCTRAAAILREEGFRDVMILRR